MIYVCTWNHTLNNVRFLVSDLSKKHGRLITYINKLHPYGKVIDFCLRFILGYMSVSPTTSSPV